MATKPNTATGSAIATTGNELIRGTKEFTSVPRSKQAPVTPRDLVNLDHLETTEAEYLLYSWGME